MSTALNTAGSMNSAMIKVYQYVVAALVFTGLIAAGVETTPAALTIATNPIVMIVLFIIMLVLVSRITAARECDSTGKLMTLFAVFTALEGVLLAGVFAAYTNASIFVALFSAAILFIVMSMYGYFTKRDITSFGQYLAIAMIALLIVMVINLFIGSSAMTTLIAAVAVLLFLCVTAYEAQVTREMLLNATTSDEITYAQINGAVGLYLSFINLFLNILELVGVPVRKS